MPIASHTPVYNLSAVLKETGLQGDVLRAWERRYGLPKPQRTAGGHRLYSDYDIAIIKWLRARQQEGLSISRAVALWNEITGTGRDPLGEHSETSGVEVDFRRTSSDQIDLSRVRWLGACLAFDTVQAEGILNQAFAQFPVETVSFEIITRGISEIGNFWRQGKASVQQEHFTTAIGIRRIQALIAASPSPTRNQTILVGCPEGEAHSYPLILLTLMLRRRGWNVTYLDASIPVDQLETTAQAVSPALIVMAAQQLRTAAALRSAAVLLQNNGYSMAYGGLIFNRIPGIRSQIPAYFLAEDLKTALDRLEQLALAPAVFPAEVVPPETYTSTAEVLLSRIPMIDTSLLASLTEIGVSDVNLIGINAFFSESLAAALMLGSPQYVEPDLEWVEKLLQDRSISPESLYAYLNKYGEAVHKQMGAEGFPITKWIESYVAGK